MANLGNTLTTAPGYNGATRIITDPTASFFTDGWGDGATEVQYAITTPQVLMSSATVAGAKIIEFEDCEIIQTGSPAGFSGGAFPAFQSALGQASGRGIVTANFNGATVRITGTGPAIWGTRPGGDGTTVNIQAGGLILWAVDGRNGFLHMGGWTADTTFTGALSMTNFAAQASATGFIINNVSFDGTVRDGAVSANKTIFKLGANQPGTNAVQLITNCSFGEFDVTSDNEYSVFQAQNLTVPVWSINNRFEHATIPLNDNSGATAGDFREFAAIRTNFNQTGTTTPIQDVKIVGIPTTGDDYSVIVPLSYAANTALPRMAGASEILYNATLGGHRGMLLQEDAILGTSGNGFNSGGGATSYPVNAEDEATKALDFTTGALVTGRNFLYKSYSHRPGSDDYFVMTTNPSNLTISRSGTNNEIVWTSADTVSYQVDEFLGTSTVSPTEAIAIARVANTTDDLYPVYKDLWYHDDAIQSNPALSVSGTTISSSLGLGFLTTGDNAQTSDEIRIEVPSGNGFVNGNINTLTMTGTTNATRTVDFGDLNIFPMTYNNAILTGWSAIRSGANIASGTLEFAGGVGAVNYDFTALTSLTIAAGVTPTRTGTQQINVVFATGQAIDPAFITALGALTNVSVTVLAPAVNYTLTIPNTEFIGYVAGGYRPTGSPAGTPFTMLPALKAQITSPADVATYSQTIASSDPALAMGNTVSIFTSGAGFRTTVTSFDVTRTNTSVDIGTAVDVNANPNAGTTALPSGVSVSLVSGQSVTFTNLNTPSTQNNLLVFNGSQPQEFIVGGTFIFGGDTTNTVRSILAINEGSPISTVSFTPAYTGTINTTTMANVGLLRLNINGTDGSNNISSDITNSLLASARGDTLYIDELLTRGVTEDLIFFRGTTESTVNRARVIFGTAAGPNARQQQIQNVGNFRTIFGTVATGVGDVIGFPATDGITATQVADAIDNTSAVGNRLAFLVGNRLGTKGSAPYRESETYTPDN